MSQGGREYKSKNLATLHSRRKEREAKKRGEIKKLYSLIEPWTAKSIFVQWSMVNIKEEKPSRDPFQLNSSTGSNRKL